MLNVQIISKEMIKPSSPTSHALINHKLSLLDQIAPPVYIPMIFFFNEEQLTKCHFDRAHVSQRLKKSLSNTLVLFYPLAGRLEVPHSVNCNDEGAEFIEAEVKYTNLSCVVGKPNMEELKQLLPMDPCVVWSMELILSIQINYFDCGGIAIGICLSHKIVDGLSFVTFINSWAAKSGGASNIMLPNFDLARRFPARKASFNFQMPTTGENEKIVTKRFLFDKKMITTLKTVAAFGSQVKDPTRVEAISVFIWKHFLKIANAKNKKINSCIAHAVNLRQRMGESNFFGNLWRTSMAIIGAEQHCDDQDLLSLSRRSIKELDNDFLKNLANGDGYVDCLKNKWKMLSKGEAEFCNFSSWCRFPVYETDFGWGKPVWVCTATMPFKNLVILMSTRCGEGIEAWVNWCVRDMAMFEEAYKLLSLSSTD